MGHANDTNKLIQQFICQFISITNLIEYDSRGSNNNPSSMAMQVNWGPEKVTIKKKWQGTRILWGIRDSADTRFLSWVV